MPNPDTATDKQLSTEKVELGDSWACYYDQYWGLVYWIRENLFGEKMPANPTPLPKPPKPLSFYTPHII